MKNYDLLSIKRTYGFLGCKTKIGQVWFRTIRPRWQPYGKILENRENTKPIWQGKGKKDEMGTRWYTLRALVIPTPHPPRGGRSLRALLTPHEVVYPFGPYELPTRWQTPSCPINSPRGGISLRALLTSHEVVKLHNPN